MTAPVDSFTICVLFFGDYPDLAKRCLDSLRRLPQGVRIRIGENQAGEATRKLVDEFVANRPVEMLQRHATNQCKYPVMRELFYSKPLETEYVCWMDDDSSITAGDTDKWLSAIHGAMQSADMLGSLYRMRFRGNQYRWVERQPW